MSRPILCLDITSFRSPEDRDRFLAWACRKLHSNARHKQRNRDRRLRDAVVDRAGSS